MRYVLVAMTLLFGSVTPAVAGVNVTIGVPVVNVGFDVPGYPQFTIVPNYPVYYAPNVNTNLFFYDGLYWAYHRDNWYASSWYNGPWSMVNPVYVPTYILQVPVRYYRVPPPYFHGWPKNKPPRWGQYWGPGWEHERHGWTTWRPTTVVVPAPLPVYQREYPYAHYPRLDEQGEIRERHYDYRPSDPVARYQYEQHYSGPGGQSNGPPHGNNGMPPGQAKKQGHGHDNPQGDRR